jgi:hypothetical protein
VTFAQQNRDGEDGRCRQRRNALRGLALAGVVALSLLAAACGGGSSAAKVAQVDTTTSVDQSSSAGSNRGSGDSYSSCMRSHGVPLFPDPNSNGQFSPGGGVDPNSPQFRAAQSACRSLLPKGGSFSADGAHLSPQQVTQRLKYARCMRSHGLPKFPDPGSHGGALEPDQVDPNSSQFKSADRACRALLPKLPRGGTHTASGGGK